MERGKNFLNRLKERYLFSFLLTLLLPCVVVVAFVQSTYIKQMDEHVLSAAQERAARIEQEFNQTYAHMRTAADSISLATEFNKTTGPEDYSRMVQIQNLLSMMLINQKSISNIFVYQANNEYIFSAKGTYDKSIFCSAYNVEDMTSVEFFQFLDGSETGPLNVKTPLGESLLYTSHFVRNRTKMHILFLVERSVLREQLRQHLTDGTGMLCIRNLSGETMAIYTNDVSYSADLYEQILAQSPGESGLATVGNTRYVVARSVSASNGFEVVSVITGDSLFEQIQKQNNIWVLMLLIALLVGMIMVIYLSNIMYKPIHTIKKKVEGLYSGEEKVDDTKVNAYEAISAGIEFLEKESLYMRSQIESHHQYLISRLLNNGLKGNEDLDQLCSVFGWDRNKEVFYVSLMKADVGYGREELVEYLRTVQMRELRFLVKEMYQEGIFAVIWNADRENCSSIDEQLAIVQADNSHSLRVTGSEQWCFIEEIPHAFVKVIVKDSLAGTKITGMGLMPGEACRHVHRHIGNRSWAKAAKAMETLMRQLETAEDFRIRYVCLILALSLPEDPDWDQSRFSTDIFKLAKITDGQYYRDYLDAIMAYLRESAIKHEKNEGQDVPLIIKMDRYLAVKYNDPAFSVQEMADEFNMSMPGLSKYFHEKHGKLLNEYVTELKMNRATFLLENTDMSVVAISREVGYFNPGSFGRRFRQVIGVSPLEYRRSKKGITEDAETEE